LQQALRTARQTAGLTQIDTAQLLGQPQSYVSKYEAGTRRLDLIELVAVCAVLGIGVQDLVEVVNKEMDRK
jgi:transcriptional regulator with XRE-family HTH domain